jgi:hypothetical protein
MGQHPHDELASRESTSVSRHAPRPTAIATELCAVVVAAIVFACLNATGAGQLPAA